MLNFGIAIFCLICIIMTFSMCVVSRRSDDTLERFDYVSLKDNPTELEKVINEYKGEHYTYMKRVAKFEKITFDQFKKDWNNTFREIDDKSIMDIYDNIKLPIRATEMSAGHDISTPIDVTLFKNDTVKIPTGIRCKMEDGYVMLVFPRSSLGIKKGMVISNTVPVIDGDYYNADNEGHIFICIKNTSEEIMKLKAGDNIVQAVFVPFGVADQEEVTARRTGGIGSTN